VTIFVTGKPLNDATGAMPRHSKMDPRVAARETLTVPGFLLAVEIASMMILDTVGELILGMRHVVDGVAVLVAVLVLVAPVQEVVLSEMVVQHDVRHLHLVLWSLHRPVEMHVRAGHRGMMVMEDAVQRYHAGD